MRKFAYFILVIICLSVAFFYLINSYSPDPVKTYIEKSKKTERGPDKRPYEWEWMRRTYPYYNADPDAISNAIKKAHEMKFQLKKKYLAKNKQIPQWEFAGPVNVGGRVVDIEFNPLEPNIVYAAAATGGVFKSSDTGQTWSPIFDDQAVLTIGDIGIDPVNPNIIFVGTGEANGGHNNFPGGGIYKSTDAGESWKLAGLEGTTSIGRIVINPLNTNIIYVAAVGSYFAPTPQRGLYKSTDGGTTWSKSLFVSDSTGAIDIVMDKNNPNKLLVAKWERVRGPNVSHLYGSSSGIYKSVDGGASWEKLGVDKGLPDPNLNKIGRIGLTISPSNPDIVFALFNDGSFYTGLYVTHDFGATWERLDPNNLISQGTSSFSWYFGQVRVHPNDPNTIFVMDVAFMKSTDKGSTWPIIYGYGGPEELHVDHHALAFHPSNPDYLINGNDGGINISTDGGNTWSNRALLPVTQFYEIGLDINAPQALYGGTQDNGTIRTKSGNTNDWDAIFGGDGFYVIVDPINPNIIYAESQFGGLGKSIDGGMTFNYALDGVDINEPVNWSAPLVMDPQNHNVLYYGTDRIYRSSSAAATWQVISDDLTEGIPGTRLGTISTIAVSPLDSNLILAGTDDGRVWITTNYGNNWLDISSSLPNRWVTRVVADPHDRNTIYVTFSGLKWKDPQPHVFKSTNLGTDWQNISSNLPDAPVNAFAVDLRNPNLLYLGSDVGMFISYNSGESWEILGTGLPVVPVNDIKIHPVHNYLIAGTHGRSMYKLDLNQLTDVENEVLNVSDYTLHQNYPNPFNPATLINYTLHSEGLVNLQIYNSLGELIATLVNEYKSAGTHSIEWNSKGNSGESIASGVYYFRLKVNDFSQTKKMVLLR